MRCELEYTFFSQNVRGFGSLEKEEEVISFMRRNRVFAYALQETWRSGTQETCIHGFAIIQHGLPCPIKRKQGRLSGGVAIVLSPEAHCTWKKA